MKRRQHAPGDAGCGGYAKHCYFCDRDEEGPCYLACLECGHLYRSALALKWRYLYSFWLASPGERRAWRGWWARLRLPARDISFCPLCCHDF